MASATKSSRAVDAAARWSGGGGAPALHAPPHTQQLHTQSTQPRRAWVALVGAEAAKQTLSVCIGSTSARACEAAGMSRILYPDAPGIDTWVECVLEALEGSKQPAAR